MAERKSEKDTLANLGKMSDDELTALAASDDREQVQNTVKKEQDRRAAQASDADATDAAAKLAEEKGVDISEIEGTGKDGRVTVDDVRAAADDDGVARTAQDNATPADASAAFHAEDDLPAGKLAADQPNSYDLIGEDGRRILRWHGWEACRDKKAEISATTGEQTTIKTSPDRP